MIILANDIIAVTLSEKGAELQSLQYNGLEYIWQADEKYWGKHSPILFPIVGELKNGKYTFEGKVYDMPRHGFARDKIFEGVQTSAASAILTLKSDEASLLIYPFKFILKVHYCLEGNRLFCSYSVENAGKKNMLFSIGGHPAFNVPLQPNLQYSDYRLRFDKDTILKKYELHNGLTGEGTEDIMLNNNELQLQHSLFYKDAIVLKNINSSQVELLTNKDAYGLRLNFDGFPYFGIWAAKNAPFICLEPWCGIADQFHHDQELINKEGINHLGVSEKWKRTWSIEVLP